MDKLIYTAMTGAQQAMQALSKVSNNLANVSTTGFRADLQASRSRPVEGGGLPTRVQTEAESQGWDSRSGSVVATGRQLDVAIVGKGWLAVQTAGGGEAYTRAGDMRIGASGALETGSGHLVLGNGGPITIPPHQKIFLGDDGMISVVPQGQKGNVMVEVDRLRLVNPPSEQLSKGSDGLIRMRDGSEADTDAAVKVASGHLESSNVNAAEALVEMIQISRHYEMQLKAIKTAEENEQSSSALLRLGS
ncbi:MAG: flagellar basal-body rod protein FlgF [Gammaproteobacteria bacterium]|nr:flagellar basal-body rod protein FlgF [Gammaproteobacteria bacterium]